MSTITIEVTEADLRFYAIMADFHGTSLPELIKAKSLEALEDEFDRQTLQHLREENQRDTNHRLISADQVKQTLGL